MVELDTLLRVCETYLATLPPCPENRATAAALADARAWQAARQAILASTKGAPQDGLGWEEI
jgi:hypothetical protein